MREVLAGEIQLVAYEALVSPPPAAVASLAPAQGKLVPSDQGTLDQR